jgi:hypothetical protein
LKGASAAVAHDAKPTTTFERAIEGSKLRGLAPAGTQEGNRSLGESSSNMSIEVTVNGN